MDLGEAIESAYLTWKKEQHRLTPKYEIMRSLMPLVKKYNVTMEEYYNQLKITFQHYNGFVKYSGSIGIIYITFLRAGISTPGLYYEELVPVNYHFQWPARTKIQRIYQSLLKEGNGDIKFLRCPDIQDYKF